MTDPTSHLQPRQSDRGAVPSREIISNSVEETQALGERLGRLLRAGDVVACYGPLGSGKTTLIQGIVRGAGGEARLVKSPTFVLMREYPPGPPVAGAGAGGPVPIVHLDGYRLEGAPAVAWLDLDWLFSPHKITLIEWAERCEGLLPESHLDARLTHVSTNRRRCALVPVGARAEQIAAGLDPTTPTSHEASCD